jgi:hypothetical protein
MYPGPAKETVRKPAIELECDPRLVFYSNRNGVTMRNKVAVAAAVASAFIVLAVAGSFFTSDKMNRTAEEHAMSAGRPGESTPNGLQEFQNNKAARGPTTTGSNSNSSVPPASR